MPTAFLMQCSVVVWCGVVFNVFVDIPVEMELQTFYCDDDGVLALAGLATELNIKFVGFSVFCFLLFFLVLCL